LGNDHLVNVVLPEVEEIGANMFSGCTSLQSVDIPASVTTIGEGAFKDCESLETLYLTSIENVGAGAFEGCDNLTTITFLAGHDSAAPASAPARASRASSGIHEDAFKGLNPNCIIILDEGVTAPSSAANCLYTSAGMITETLPDGTTLEREGRIYTADGNINFTNAYPLSIPNAFTLTDGAEVTLEVVPTDRWASLIVPFNVESVKTAGKEMKLFEAGVATADKQYIVFGMPEGGEDVKTVSTIDANTPYLWRTDATGPVTFSAGAIRVAATPSSMVSEGAEFALNATYKAVELPATKTYLLDKDGYACKPAGDNVDETATVEPFTVYATSPVD
ncbi:MAG: leucine-rich repeat domain-containing protein, partial [Muribaculaceae bacterium]|nr:leucine-rich repeat domain-containing protein [Muribaculaceae bacterium]